MGSYEQTKSMMWDMHQHDYDVYSMGFGDPKKYKWKHGDLAGIGSQSKLALRAYGAEQRLFGSGAPAAVNRMPTTNRFFRAGKYGVSKGLEGSSWMRSRFLQQSGYKSLTQAIGKNIGHVKGIGIGGVLFGAAEVAMSGDISAGNMAHALKEGIVMDLSFRLAAPGAGMLRQAVGGMGWGVAGSALGLSTTQTLGLQAATYMIGGKAAVAAVGAVGAYATLGIGAAYFTGKGMYHGVRALHESGSQMRKTEFSTGDMSYASSNAATMRQRAVGQIQKSHMNARAMLGNEGLTYARAIGG